MPANPVIFVPGITATYLRDEYPLPPEIVWAVIKKKFRRVSLHPNDLRYEAEQPARVVPDQIYEIAYEELVEELRYNLSDREDEPVPVYPFGYDWRQPLESIQSAFRDFVEEVIDRTKLMRHYHPRYAENPKVDLIGHSMGGLIIAGYANAYGAEDRIGKVVTLASPFQGSFEAVIKVATGTANLGTKAPSSREREAARVTPALYYLLPSFKKGINVAPQLPKSLFDPGIWQPSILDTLAEYVRLHHVPFLRTRTERMEVARALFKGMLKNAKSHRSVLDGFKLEKANLTARDWLCVVGVDATTRVGLNVIKQNGAPQFDLRSSDRANLWPGDNTAAQRRRTGDGTVPFEGAVPKFLDEHNLVCVTPDDYGYWEIGDRVTNKIGGFHGILPNMNMLQRMIVRHFRNLPDRKKNTWGASAPGVSEDDWEPPLNLDWSAPREEKPS